jgi:hypothetical protein
MRENLFFPDLTLCTCIFRVSDYVVFALIIIEIIITYITIILSLQEDAGFIEDEINTDVPSYLKSENEAQTTEEERSFIKTIFSVLAYVDLESNLKVR